MRPDFEIGQSVYVPANKLNPDKEYPYSLVKAEVTGERKSTLSLIVPNEQGPIPGTPLTMDVSKSFVKSAIHVTVYEIGDDDSEPYLLDPLAKTVQNYLNLLLPSDMRVFRKFRTRDEFEHFWDRDKRICTHLVLIGHGSRERIKLAFEPLGHQKLFELLNSGMEKAGKTDILSLCCQTGANPIARQLSSLPFCSSFIAPFHSVHGAVASQFFSSLFGHYFLGGRTMKVAYNKSNANLVQRTNFRFWKNGLLQ